MEKEKNEIGDLKSQINQLSWKIDILENNYIDLYSKLRPPLYSVGDEVSLSGNSYKWIIIDYEDFSQHNFYNNFMTFPTTVKGILFNMGFARSKGPYKYTIKLDGLNDVTKEVFEDEINNHHETTS